MDAVVIPAPVFDKNWKIILIIGVLCFTAYFPAFHNGFIADDYVILERTQELRRDPLLLMHFAPDTFRATTYLAFGMLKGFLAYNASFFYLFTILLHSANACLLQRLLLRLTRCSETAFLGAVVFTVFQNPQEAVMWLSAMNEALLGFFVLITLLLWGQGRSAAASLSYLAALFSKESAVMVLGLIPLLEICVERRFRFLRASVYLIGPTLIFACLYIALMPQNPMISQGLYVPGWRALQVWVRSLHGLMFPWFYLALALFLFLRRSDYSVPVLFPILWIMVALIPYIFLTYQNHVPSRHEYMASMGLAWGLAVLVKRWPRPHLARAFIVLLILGNIAYLWIVKEKAYEMRAAPTRLLIQELKSRQPQPLLLEDFPYNPWVAKMTTRVVPGWGPEMISCGPRTQPCSDCLVLRWDSKTSRYRRE